MDSESKYKAFTKKIDAQSLEMISDFRNHLDKVKEQESDADDRLIFEGWAIQKIAGLQIIIKELA